MKYLIYIFITTGTLHFSCTQTKKAEPVDDKLPKAATQNQTVLTSLDTVIGKDFALLKAELNLDNKGISFYNTFDKWDGGFNMEYYEGLKIVYNGDTLKNLKTLASSSCQNFNLKFFFAPWGDSIDNLDGFHYTKVANGSVVYLIQSGYFYGCNGKFCNNGALLILKFHDNKLQNGYIIGINKSKANAIPTESYMKDEKLNLKFEVLDNNERKDYATIAINDSIQINSSNVPAFFCVK